MICDKCGYMLKLGSRHKLWRRWWFVLNSGELTYYKSPVGFAGLSSTVITTSKRLIGCLHCYTHAQQLTPLFVFVGVLLKGLVVFFIVCWTYQKHERA